MITATALPGTAALPDEAMLTVGIDVGGTKTACVVTDAHDNVLRHEVVATDAAHLAGQLSDLVRLVVAELDDSSDGAVGAVGVAVPGFVEPDTGTIRLAVNLGGTDMPLGPILEHSLGLPCYVEHDARAAASWVDSSPATGHRAGDVAYLSVGTGLSAGIVLDGHVLRGSNGFAGEVGHVIADPNDGRCACGLVGCMETVAAGPAIARLARAELAAGRASALTPASTPTDILRAAQAGDELAVELTTNFAVWLARAIRGLVLSFGVTQVVIGGGVASAGDALLGPVLEAIGRERDSSPLVEAAFADVSVDILPPETEAGARGAAAIARRRFLANRGEGVGEG